MTKSVPVWFDTLLVGAVSVSEDGSLGFGYSDRWLAP